MDRDGQWGVISSSSSSSEEGARVELGKVATLEVTQHLAGQDGVDSKRSANSGSRIVTASKDSSISSSSEETE